MVELLPSFFPDKTFTVRKDNKNQTIPILQFSGLANCLISSWKWPSLLSKANHLAIAFQQLKLMITFLACASSTIGVRATFKSGNTCPLGPFLAKNFASSMSPWIVTLDALEPFRTNGPVQDPKVLPYLEYEGDKHIDINLEVLIQPENEEAVSVCQSNYKHMYWNMNQQLAHHTVNGCDIHAGDMMASGTISGSEEGSYGSMLEISWRGTKPVPMPNGTERKFINDHDTVTMCGFAEKAGVRVGFGEVSTKVLPAK